MSTSWSMPPLPQAIADLDRQVDDLDALVSSFPVAEPSAVRAEVPCLPCAGDPVASPQALNGNGHHKDLPIPEHVVPPIRFPPTIPGDRLVTDQHPWIQRALAHFGTTSTLTNGRYVTPGGKIIALKDVDDLREIAPAGEAVSAGSFLSDFLYETGTLIADYAPGDELTIELARRPTAPQRAILTRHADRQAILQICIHWPDGGLDCPWQQEQATARLITSGLATVGDMLHYRPDSRTVTQPLPIGLAAGIVVDTTLATTTPCTRLLLSDGESVVYSPGIIGALDDAQIATYCSGGIEEQEASPEQQRILTTMRAAIRRCTEKTAGEPDPIRRAEAFWSCTSRRRHHELPDQS